MYAVCKNKFTETAFYVTPAQPPGLPSTINKDSNNSLLLDIETYATLLYTCLSTFIHRYPALSSFADFFVAPMARRL